MLHVCVQKFDVTGTVQIFLGTKRSLKSKPPMMKIKPPYSNRMLYANTNYCFTQLYVNIKQMGALSPKRKNGAQGRNSSPPKKFTYLASNLKAKLPCQFCSYFYCRGIKNGQWTETDTSFPSHSLFLPVH